MPDESMNPFRRAAIAYLEHLLDCRTCKPDSGLPEGSPLCPKGQELWDGIELEESALLGEEVTA